MRIDRRIVAGAVVVAIGALLVWTRGGHDEVPGDRASVATSPTAVAANAPRASRALAAATPGALAVGANQNAGISTDDPLTFYRKANVYPPTSHPLAATMTDLTKPNARHEQPQPMDQDDGIVFTFTADRYYVIGDETLTATLSVTRGGKPIAPTIDRAFYVVLDPINHREMPLAFDFDPAGTQIAPAKLGLARQSGIGVYVEFSAGGAKQRTHLDFQYTPATGIPARFTGAFSDEVSDGSLVVHAGVDVQTAGDYLIDCNLYDANEQPVAWTRFKGSLAAGAQHADLVFFGKVLVDGGVAGPYHIGQLRGSRYDATKDPDLEMMPAFAGSYATRAYPLTAFSSREWDSADKQRMIEFLSSQKERGVLQGGAAPGDPGMPSPPGK